MTVIYTFVNTTPGHETAYRPTLDLDQRSRIHTFSKAKAVFIMALQIINQRSKQHDCISNAR